MRAFVVAGFASLIVLVSTANAQKIYKCTSPDGTTGYASTPCPGGKEIAVAASRSPLNLRQLALREANLAYECSDALSYLLLDPAKTSRPIVSQFETFRQQFDRFCPQFGYRPFSANTKTFNEEHRGAVNNILRETHPDAPSGTRSYGSHGRSPPLFSGF